QPSSLADPRGIVRLAGRQPGDDQCHARRFSPAVLAVSEVQVMNNFRELAERRIVRTESFNQRFEWAPIAFVSEIRLGHVEAQLPRTGRFTGAHEAELRLTVEEPLNESS